MISINDLNVLPKYITCDGVSYSFKIFVTAWGKFCMAYVSTEDNITKLFSVVIDNEAETETAFDCNGISTVPTLEDAYTLMYDTMVAEGVIDIEEEDISECVEMDFDNAIAEQECSLEDEAVKFRNEHFSIEDYDLI